MKKFEVIKRHMNVNSSAVDLHKLILSIKAKAEEIGYTFYEMEQGSEPKKYGEERGFNIYLEKEIDYFGKIEINIDSLFERLEKVKNKYIGNGTINYKVAVILDYKKRWDNSSLNKFLFSLYLKIMKWNFEDKYITHGIIDGNRIYDQLKEELDEY